MNSTLPSLFFRIIFPFLFVFINHTVTHAQVIPKDTLLQQLAIAKEDTNKVKILNNLCYYSYWNGEYGFEKQYAEQAIVLAQKINYRDGEGNALIYLSKNTYRNGDSTSAFQQLNQAKTLFLQTNNQNGIAGVYNQFADFFEKSDLLRAIENSKKALAIFIRLDYTSRIASTQRFLGEFYAQTQASDTAFDYLNKALKYAIKSKNIDEVYQNLRALNDLCLTHQYGCDSLYKLLSQKIESSVINDTLITATYYQFLAQINTQRGKYSNALYNHFARVKLLEQMNQDAYLGRAYLDIAAFYNDYFQNNRQQLKYILLASNLNCSANKRNRINGALASCYYYLRDYQKALQFYKESLSYSQKAGDRMGEGCMLSNIGGVYNAINKPQEALAFYLRALKILDDKSTQKEYTFSVTQLIMADCYNGIGISYLGLNNYSQALVWLNKADNTFSKIQAPNENLLQNYRAKSTLYEKLNDYKNSLKYERLYEAIKDSVLNEKNLKQANEMNALYETEKKDYEIKLLNKDKQIQTVEVSHQKKIRNGFIGGFAVMLLFAGVFLVQRNRISKEKQRSEDLLLNILPSEVAEELKNKGSADAKLFDEVTVLFTDFKSFTTVSERLSPQELVNELNECFKAFDEIIGKYNIEKIKTVGDAYLAAAGLPSANPTHADDMIKAALEIQAFMINRKKQLGDRTFEMRAGIHSGPVVAGIVGVKKFAYDIWGDTVNTAARMEQNSEAGKVNISEATYELVKDQFNCQYRGEIEAKNKGKMKMYFVDELAP